ncbi:MAG: hypothetical protein ACRC8W_03075 [Plesiomonas shigelloides]
MISLHTVKRNKAGLLVYKLIDRNKKCNFEKLEQIHLWQLIKTYTPKEAALTWHSVNEGKVEVQHRLSLISQGMNSGVSDIISIHPGIVHPSAAIELKRESMGTISAEQATFLHKAEESGVFACVAYGAYCGWMAWLDYLGIDDEEMRRKAYHLIR